MFNVNDVKPQTNAVKTSYPHLETGTYGARIVQVIGLGVQERPAYKGEAKPPAPFIRITFELPYETIDRQMEDGSIEKQPRWLSKEMVFSGSDMSTCVKWLNKIDPSNSLGGDWANTIGKELQVYVTATQGKKDPTKYYNDVKDVLSVPKGMAIPDIYAPEKKMVFSTRHVTDKTVEQFNSMPKWLQEKITGAIDFPNSPLEKAMSGTTVATPPPAPEQPVVAENTSTSVDDDPWG